MLPRFSVPIAGALTHGDAITDLALVRNHVHILGPVGRLKTGKHRHIGGYGIRRPYLHGRDALRITAALLNPGLRVVAAEDADCLVTFHCAHRAVAYVTHRTCVIGESATLIRPDQQTDAGREVWSGKINDRAGLIGDRPRGDDHVDLSIVQHGAPVFGANLFEDDLLVRIAEFGGHVFGDGDVEAWYVPSCHAPTDGSSAATPMAMVGPSGAPETVVT